ncbi:AbiH family protein [Klebsiella variicola]
MSRVYGVESELVLHIHGSAETRDDDLILGHAWKPESRPLTQRKCRYCRD